MQAKTIQGSTIEAIQSALTKSMADGFQPTLALVFMSKQIDRTAICSIFEGANITIFGSTTSGEFTNAGITSQSAAILLLNINPDHFKLVFKDFGDQPLDEVAKQVATIGKTTFANPAFMISACHLAVSYESIIAGFVATMGEEVTLIGGNAGDDFTFEGSYVFNNTQMSHAGIVALILDADKIAIEGQAVSGWKPVGTTKTVTKSEGNWVHTIDNQPALDLLIKYTGIEVHPEDEENFYVQFGPSFPLQVIHEAGNPVMKPPLMCNRETKAIMCGGVVPQGSKVRFSLPPDFDLI